MGYTKEIYDLASQKLDNIRRNSIREANMRRESLYKKYPRAKEIERLLSSTAVSAAKAVLNGENTKEQLTKLKASNMALQEELSEILKKEGLKSDYLDIKYSCNYCKDEGYVDGIMCSCMKQLLRKEAYNKLNSLSPLSLCSFDSFLTEFYSTEPIRENGPSPRKRMEDILRYCKNYAANFALDSQSLLMQGATGLGKTHLSLAIAKVAINKGYGVIYGSAPNIITKLEKERFRFSKDDESLNSDEHLISCDLLILDDLGTEFSTSFSNATIYNIINSRIMANKPTIISTNLSLKELEKAYTERLVSRVIGNTVRLEFLGHDVRQKKHFKSRTRN